MDRAADQPALFGFSPPGFELEKTLGRPPSLQRQLATLAILLILVTGFGLAVHDLFRLTPVLVCLFVSTIFSLFTTLSVTVLSSLLFAVVADYLFIEEPWHIAIDIHFLVRLSVFLLTALLTNYLARMLRTAYAQSSAARQAAEAANREKDEILAILAHDLRAPLTAAQLSLQLIERQLPPSDHREAVLRNAERAREACKRVNGLVLDLLDSARADSGGISIHREPHDLAAVLRTITEEMRVLAAQNGITLEADIPESMTISCDTNRIAQLVTNLLGNAFKFTPRGGTVKLSLWWNDGRAILSVSDTGIGMTPEQRRHVFERFWQAERSKRSGVGLGLFIVKAIVDAHGGNIMVESEPHKGTTFTVALPA